MFLKLFLYILHNLFLPVDILWYLNLRFPCLCTATEQIVRETDNEITLEYRLHLPAFLVP